MENVAMSLVATMMQSSFSGTDYNSSLQGSKSTSSFDQVFSTAKSNSYEISKSYDSKEIKSYKSESKSFINDSVTDVSRDTTKTYESSQENLTQVNKEVQTESNNSVNNPVNNEVNKQEPIQEEPVEVTEDTKVIKSIDDMSVEMVGDLQVLTQEVVDELAATLEMDVDEVVDLLNELGVNVTDLFNIDNLKTLVTEAMGLSDPMELLIVDDGLETLNNLSDALTEISEEHPELMNQLEQLANNAKGDEGVAKANDFVAMLNDFQDPTGGKETAGDAGSQEGSMDMASSENKNMQTNTANQMTSGFEGVLNQVVTQKTETIIMNGTVQTIQTEVTAKNVFDQIVTGMKVQVTDTKSNVLLELNPNNLGKVGVSLSNENGVVTGQFVAESEAVKEVIEANLSALKIQLQEQGIEVDKFEITVGDASKFLTGEQEKENSSNSGKNKKNKNAVGNISEILAERFSEENLEETSVVHENSSIELHA